jgi:uncharacterized BrkB/YihY/UPF0761 family membrane protein
MSLRNREGKKSTIRVSLYWVIGMAVGLIIAIITAIVIQAFKSMEINWQGIALTIGAVGVFIAPAFGFKALQTQYEEK